MKRMKIIYPPLFIM